MAKLWLVAKHEYLRVVRQKSFLIATLGMPALIALVMAIAIYFAVGRRDSRPVGYVDRAGVLAAGIQAPVDEGERAVRMQAFANEAAARAALQAGSIQAFYVLGDDYSRSRQVALFFWDSLPNERIQEQFEDMIRANLAAHLPSEVQIRMLEGPTVTIRSADGLRRMGEEDFMAFLLPLVGGAFFAIAVMASSSYLLQAVTTEKENRTMEVMIVSMSPEQLIGGKALGLLAVGLTQLLIWAVAAVAAIQVGAQFTPLLRGIEVPWPLLGLAALFFVPAYAFAGGIMTAIGSAVTDTRQGQQIAGMLNLLFNVPFFFVAVIMTRPNSALVVALTLFPITAFLTVMLRWSVATIPLAQVICSWVLLAAAAGFSIWAAARILRVGMLRYGQRLDLRAAVRAIRAKV